MLYIFRMDIGQMLTVDMSFLMDTVSRLQSEIARITGIPLSKQILLVSGGHSLKHDQKVMSYGAGADTNPVFLFSKMALESKDPPLIRASLTKDVLSALKDSLNRVMNMPPQIESVSTGTKIACQIRDSAAKILNLCKSEFNEQHLQYQGWGTVVANLEETAQALQHSKSKFLKAVSAFIPAREQYFTMLKDFSDVVELLQRIPLLKSLRDEKDPASSSTSVTTSGTGRGRGPSPPITSTSLSSGHGSFIMSTSFTPTTLLDWITLQGQGQSLESLRHKCQEDLQLFNKQMFDHINLQVEEVLKEVNYDPHSHKTLAGIERRLSDLEKRYNEAVRLADEQNDVTQNFFLKHASSLSRTVGVASVLPDLCHALKQQLRQMVERQQRIEALHNNFLKSKQEMCTNIHQRLGWVMHVETNISKLDNELVFHMKTIKILECNLELLGQVKAAPSVYADVVFEAARRREFSNKFTQWAENIAGDSTQIYRQEIERRKAFAKSIGDHFLLDTLFKGLEDMPPSFATKAPSPFDRSLPDITTEDIELLRTSVPELKLPLRVPDEETCFPFSSPARDRTDSPFAHIGFPASQSSQTDWSEQPSVVKATEAPATKFTLPEIQESRASQNLPQVYTSQSSLATRLSETPTDVARDSASDETRDHSVQAVKIGPARSPLAPVYAASSGASAAGSLPGKSYLPFAVMSPLEREQHMRMGMSPPQTESTSPPSSTEFATADFYFEDSMPSPLASSSERPKEDSSAGSSDCKRVSDPGEGIQKGAGSMAALQAQLVDKEHHIRELEKRLKELAPSSQDFHQQLPDSQSSQQQEQKQQQQQLLLLQGSDIPDTAVPSLSLSEGGSSTPPMEDALDISLVVGSSSSGRQDIPVRGAGSNDSNSQLQQLQQDLDVITSDLAKTRSDLADSERLRQDLEQANLDLVQTVKDLQASETTLKAGKEVAKVELQSRDKLIGNLRTDLSKVSSDFAEREQQILSLREELEGSHNKVKELGELVERREESLRQVKGKLLTVRGALVGKLSHLRQDLEDVKSSVVNTREEQRTTMASTLTSLEQEVSRLSTQSQRERDGLQEEIQGLKSKLCLAESAAAEQDVLLQTVREESEERLAQQDEVAQRKLQDTKTELETKLKDAATKHALELELELDRCGADLKEKDEALAQAAEELSGLREKVELELKQARLAADEERERLALAYSENLRQAEESNVQGLETATARIKAEHVALLDVTTKEMEERMQQKESEIASLKQQLHEERESALKALREKLESEHASVQADLIAQVKELKESLAQTLEKTQLDHANKLTQLKAEFETEREGLQAELSNFKDRPRTDSFTEPDLVLTMPACCGQTQTEERQVTVEQTQTEAVQDVSSCETQTELGLWECIMATSETQTELNLLADVISLTSSISYGSDEMIAQKLTTSITVEDKEGATSTAASTATTITAAEGTNVQETIDDLNLQLACAQEKIASLNEEIRTLREVVKESGACAAPDISPLPLAQAEGGRAGNTSASRPSYQDMMASSGTAASFILMEGDAPGNAEGKHTEPEVIKSKDQKIAQLEKKLRDIAKDKVSIKGCDKADIVLLCLDESHDQYVVFTVGTYLHFLHSESLEVLGLKTSIDSTCKKSWILAEVVDKEFCLAKKHNNRFRVPQGTCFYRVKCKPWKTDSSTDPLTLPARLSPAEIQSHRQGNKPEQGGARPKRSRDSP